MAIGLCDLQAWLELPRHEGQWPESRCRLMGRYVVPEPRPYRPVTLFVGRQTPRQCTVTGD
jgi:hypothetical protein